MNWEKTIEYFREMRILGSLRLDTYAKQYSFKVHRSNRMNLLLVYALKPLSKIIAKIVEIA